ncbi:hypothetical protein [Nocardia sp. NPDC046763]|uniref:hypothetical protein n=1 Tax=Nocardia sp. NPDC046763 TaxID=3155256 RepID=UPI0033EE5D7E
MPRRRYACHRRDLVECRTDHGRGTRIVLAAGAASSGADHGQAQQVRRVADPLALVDPIVTPTGHLRAPRLDTIDQLPPMNVLGSPHTPYGNPLGHPTLAVPIGLSSARTPPSMSITGRHFDESSVPRAGDAYQRRTTHHLDVPTALRKCGK